MSLRLFQSIAIAGLSILAGSQALSAKTLTANIPFDFKTGGATVAAGNYDIVEQATHGIYLVRSADRNESFYITMNVPTGTEPTEAKLTFACYGRERVLSQISVPGDYTSYALAPSAIDKNVSRKVHFAPMISVPLRAK